MKWYRCLGGVCLCAVLLLSACARPKTPSASQSGSSTSEETAQAVEVEEILREEGVFQSEWGDYQYSYRVPRLTGDTPGVRAINRELERCAEAPARTALEVMEQGEEPLENQIAWTEYRSGDMLSLVVRTETMMMGMPSHYVFNYDCASGQALTGDQLLQQLGLDREAIRPGLSRSVARACSTMDGGSGMDYFYGLSQLRAESLYPDNLDASQLFLGEDGALMAVTELSIPAGGGLYPMVLEVEPEEDHSRDQTVDYGFIRAELKGDQVTLTFLQQSPADIYLGDRVEFNRPYPVEGLYGRYVDLYIGTMGQRFEPILFLADEEGHVSFCDIMECVAAGNRFYGTGPLPVPQDVIRFDQQTGDGEDQTVLAHTKSGEDVDLRQVVDQAQRAMMPELELATWGTWDMVYSASFLMEETPLIMVYRQEPDQDQLDVICTGVPVYLGMDGAGLHYHLTLGETNPIYASEEDYLERGTWETILTVPCVRPGWEGESYTTLLLKEVGGRGLWGWPTGETITLYQSFG